MHACADRSPDPQKALKIPGGHAGLPVIPVSEGGCQGCSEPPAMESSLIWELTARLGALASVSKGWFLASTSDLHVCMCTCRPAQEQAHTAHARTAHAHTVGGGQKEKENVR